MTKHYSEKQLVAFVDDELNETEYNFIKTHLKTCGRCAGYVKEIQTVFEDLDRFEAVPVEKDLLHDTMKLWEVFKKSDQLPGRNFVGSKIKKLQKIATIGTIAAGLAIGFLFGDMTRKELIFDQNNSQAPPIVLQENDRSISDIYVSLMINDEQGDL